MTATILASRDDLRPRVTVTSTADADVVAVVATVVCENDIQGNRIFNSQQAGERPDV